VNQGTKKERGKKKKSETTARRELVGPPIIQEKALIVNSPLNPHILNRLEKL